MNLPFALPGAMPEYLNHPLAWGLGGVLALMLLIALIKRLIPKRRARYRAHEFLFTQAEWRFAGALQEAIGSDWLLMGKVRIADLLAVERDPRLPRGEWLRAFSRISQKHIDYVLVDPQSGRVMCCIELDDASHERQDRLKRDRFVNAAFAQAGVPLLRIPTARRYEAQALREHIQAAIRERPAKPGKRGRKKAAKRRSA
ncbi:DUF2726 domain-containing protein [Halomonas garicola]|uniref:DUF2726 domain-containing protein n=1 Tax=Halomonas garicola TaxID=1690008 RepID=UPI0028A00F00|nr:DUF2726 domain-containing protein [Halomonas garicola]